MRIFYTVAHWIIGLLLGISTAFQLLAMFGGVLFNQYNNLPETILWLVPVWAAALVLLIVAYILLVTKAATFPFQPIILALALIGAVAAFVAAITLRDGLTDKLIITGETQGLTAWRLLYRHMSSVLVGVLIAFVALVRWIFHHVEVRQHADAAYTAASTIGLDSYIPEEPTDKKSKRLKRSLRKKQ